MKKLLTLMLALALCLGLALPAAAGDMGSSDGTVTLSTGQAFAFSAVIDENNSLWMWGQNNTFGPLGNGTQDNSNVPIKIMDNVASVSCGGNHTAAIKTDGTLWTWGANVYGQLGTGKEGYDTNSYVPVKVMENVSAVSCGSLHTAAIKTDGSLWMWGANSFGQIGNGKQYSGRYGNNIQPVKIMDDVAAVSCGSNHTAAIKKDGSLWIWGSNYRGELGNGGTGNDTDNIGGFIQTVPLKLMDNVTAISCGTQITAAIKTDGSLWIWGANYGGQLGNGWAGNVTDTRTSSTGDPMQTVPVKVLDDVAFVSCGSFHTAAIKTDGSLWVWGDNEKGALGNGGGGNEIDNGVPLQTIPLKVMDGAATVSCGSDFTLAVEEDGTLWVWGSNINGELGNGGTGNDDYYGRPIQTVPMELQLQAALPTNAVIPTSPTVAGFSDVHEDDYYAEAVQWAKETGVTGGTSATTFSPQKTVTRAEAVTFLWRAAGSPQPTSSTSPFLDVTDANAYYYNAVLWAAEQGITGGVGNNQFGRNSTLTYDQILTMLCRAAGETATGSDWSAAALTWAAENGLTDGLSFAPKSACPRADVVYCLWKQLA